MQFVVPADGCVTKSVVVGGKIERVEVRLEEVQSFSPLEERGSDDPVGVGEKNLITDMCDRKKQK